MRLWIGLTGWMWMALAMATQVTDFTPQGTVKDVRQAAVRFDRPMVALGDPRAAAPFDVKCPVAGSGKWLDDRTWVYDFEVNLPGAVRCEFAIRAGLKDAAGQPVHTEIFRFDTGGPQVAALRPVDGSSDIEERQTFVLAFDTRVKPGTLASRTSCQVKGLAERIEVEVLQGAARDAALQPLKVNQDPLFRRRFAPNAETTEVVRCKRPLPNEAEVSLVLERGIEAGSGRVSSEVQMFRFQVRPAFRVRATCDKVNARAACNPLTPIRVGFGGPIRNADARQVRLIGPGGRSWAIQLEDDAAGNPWVDSLRFAGPFPEKSTLTLTLPANLRDEDGRALANATQFPMTLRTDATPPLAKFSSAFGVLEA
ncbi:MAG: hypothetical protein H6R08_2183, partial [Proteobacteria bacterium]|nr:hypothetical protein [Pseudomonadota bacterium]